MNILHFCYFPSGDPEANWVEDVDNRICEAVRVGWEKGMLEGGQPIVIVTGWRKGAGFTNTIRTMYLPDQDDPPTSLIC